MTSKHHMKSLRRVPVEAVILCLASCVAWIACSTAEPLPPPKPAGPAPSLLGEDSARATARSAKGLAEALYAAVPEPPWGRFPGMEGERVRAPLQRVEEEGPRPVLLLMLDTTRADYLSAYGHDRETTPNIDAIASEGVRFSRFYANAPWTRPSVSSMMLSKYRHEHGIENSKAVLPLDAPTLAQRFKGAGYATAAFVGNQTVDQRKGFSRGFDMFSDDWERYGFWPVSSIVTEQAVSWIKNNDNPNWFMWMFLVDPHDPYVPAEPYDMWRTPTLDRFVQAPPIEVKHTVDPRYLARVKELYAGELRQLDASVGRLVDVLKKAGQWEDLTVLVVADHGELLGEHRSFKHSYHFWEPNINVPFILRTPLLKGGEGQVEDRLFQGVDVRPTLLDLAGIPDEGWSPSGVSAAEVLTGPILHGWDRSVYAQTDTFGIRRWMVRRGGYKYLRFAPTQLGRLYNAYKEQAPALTSVHNTTLKEHLYHLDSDPGELKDLAAERPEIAQRMGADLDRLLGDAPDVEEDPNAISKEIEDELRQLGYVE